MEPAASPSSIFRRSDDASGLDAKRAAAGLDKAIVIQRTYSESSSSSDGSHEQSFGASGGSKKNAPSEADMRRRRKCIILLSVIPLIATLAALAALLIGRSSGDGGAAASRVDSLSTEDTRLAPSPNASSTPANPNDNDWGPLVLPVEERDDNALPSTASSTEATVSSLTHGTLRATTTSAPLSSAPETAESTTLLLAHAANDGSPSNHYPLKECQGDCNRDKDCEGALLCFEGNGLEAVPGCSGDRLDGAGYCFHRPTANDLFASKERPLGNCIGYCEDDGDCGPGLICEHRSGTENIPGCNGLGAQGKDYCRYLEEASGYSQDRSTDHLTADILDEPTTYFQLPPANTANEDGDEEV